MKYYLTMLVSIFAFATLSAQGQHVRQYVERYKETAISEMHKSGIPASIKLAQGILESDSGRSDLAQNSNNHFGIKCGPIWEGRTFYKEDDDRDRHGKLIKSCFRVFSSPGESFQAHSDFLRNPNKAYRYGWLFDLDRHDYKSWAWGLKESGYATNPRYAILLISIIEKYELYSYDYYEPPSNIMVVQTPRKKPQPKYVAQKTEPKRITSSWKIAGTDHIEVIRGKVRNNGLSLVYAEKDDTPEKLAGRYSLDVGELIEYNEGIRGPSQTLSAAERVYLQRKKKKYAGKALAHTVLRGESLYEIAQIYGLRLDKLQRRNRLKNGEEPAPGEHVYLRGRVKKKDRPRLLEEGYAIESIKTGKVEGHEVKKGETLYSIARRYEITIDQLKNLNDLQSSLIMPGQILTVDL